MKRTSSSTLLKGTNAGQGVSSMKKKWLSVSISAALLVTASPAWSAVGLLDVYRMASSHDAKLSQARAEFKANQELVSIARSPLLPQVSASASYAKNDSSFDSGDVDNRNMALNVQQALYHHDSWAKYSQAKYNLKKAEYTMKSAEQDVIVRVADAYFKVLLAQEDVKLAKAKEKADKTQWDRAEASAEVGLASRTDVLQAKSSYDLSKSDRISSENNLDVAYEELMKLTGTPVHSLKEIALNVKLPKPKLNIGKSETEAQQNNLTVLQTEEQVNAASKEVDVQKAGHWLSVDLKASYSDTAYYNYKQNAYSSLRYNDSNDLNVGVYASLPLYSGGGTSSRVAQARASYQAATAGLRDAQETARLNARIQVRNVERGIELVEANRAAVKSNDAFLEAAEEGYKVGLKDLLEVLTARTNKFQARRNLASSLHNVVLSRLKLDAAVGDLSVDKLQAFDALLSDPTSQPMPSVDP